MAKKSNRRQEREARKHGRRICDDYAPLTENDIFGFLAENGYWQEAFVVAERERGARQLTTVRRYWLSLVEYAVNEFGAAIDAGRMSEVCVPDLIFGWMSSLKGDYEDVPEERLVHFAAAVAAICVMEFKDLGYEVIEDEERCYIVRSPKAA